MPVGASSAAQKPVWTITASDRAGVAQLVEYKLPKLGVVDSNLIARSNRVNKIAGTC